MRCHVKRACFQRYSWGAQQYQNKRPRQFLRKQSMELQDVSHWYKPQWNINTIRVISVFLLILAKMATYEPTESEVATWKYTPHDKTGLSSNMYRLTEKRCTNPLNFNSCRTLFTVRAFQSHHTHWKKRQSFLRKTKEEEEEGVEKISPRFVKQPKCWKKNVALFSLTPHLNPVSILNAKYGQKPGLV